MRRLVKHGIAGVGFAALTVTAAVAGLGSPAAEDVVIAVPAAVTSVESSATTATATETALEVERTARETRDAQRAKISAAAKTKAGDRAATLSSQSKAIAAQQTKLKAEQAKAQAAAKAKAVAKAKAAAKAKADATDQAEAKAIAAAVRAAEAKKRALKSQGYEPGTKDPRELARQILKNKFGYGDEQYDCFNYIIMRESMWKINATNASSGAYGIPQALPGSKMASAGSDWRTNPATQIIWGIGYMKDRYGSPCEAKTFKASHGWY